MCVCSSALMYLMVKFHDDGVLCICAMVSSCSCWSYLQEGWLETHYSSPIGWPGQLERAPTHYSSAGKTLKAPQHSLCSFSVSYFLCRSCSFGPQLSLGRNCSKYRCTFDVFLGGSELNVLLCHYLGPDYPPFDS